MLTAMDSGQLKYTVEDRSILLPYYRRWLVDPTLPLLPAQLSPNTITHLGHTANLLGTVVLLALWPESGWPFVTATLLLQLYLWCDNADGAHARRTGQCSALGELLDHGLDMLNTTYIAYLTAMGLGASPLWWVVIALLIPAAGVATYWEQSQTGVFRLGLLNQIESVTVLSVVLMCSAIFGTQVWDVTLYGDVTLRLAILIWSMSTIFFGILRNMARVAATGLVHVVPMLSLVALGFALLLAAHLGAISTIEAVVVASSSTIHFGTRMLTGRLRKEAPRLDFGVIAAAGALGGAALWLRMGHTVLPSFGPAVAVVACAVFGGQALLHAREGVQRVVRMTA